MRDALRGAVCLAVGLSSLVATVSRADQRLPTVGIEPFVLHSAIGDVVVVDVDRALIDGAVRTDASITVRGFPLTATVRVDLVLRRFSVTGPRTRLVIGSKGASDRVATFDPSQITLLRGHVPGVAGSHVYMALRAGSSTGYVDLGSGRPRYLMSSKDASGALLADGRMSVFLARSGGSPSANVPLCGVDSGSPESIAALVDSLDSRRGGGVPTATGGAAFRRGVKHMELAVETDFEFFQLIGDVDEAFAYLVEMYGAVSDIYMRDVDTRVELVFARIWDNPDDLFNDVDPSPLGEFRDYWNQNMGHVHRDLAQLFSGRRDYPFGGQATLSTLCTNRGYSVVGYAMGFFPDPTKPDPYHYDILVTAHEIGHNAGTGHTQNNGIDTCHDPDTIPQRGSIMSYCQQTWSGLNANQDFYFHSIIQDNIDAHIAVSACIVADCNMNNIDDADDIQEGVSDDFNDNGIPDECEDCNDNDILDDEDIRSGRSRDLNENAIPDECEPDCNNNNIPDDKDIADGASEDRYGDDIPDECETDCNDNGVSDYTDLQLDMPLDINRDTLLDECQDCDNDGTSDLEALGGAHFVWIASGLKDSTIRQFYGTTGVLTRLSSGGSGSTMSAAQDVAIAPDGRVLVTSAGDDRVASFDAAGAYLGDLVPTGRGGLDHPTGLTFTRDGRLLVASRDTNSVLAYDRTDGTFLGEFVSAGDGGLAEPFGLTIGPDGDLYATSSTNEIIRYNGADGSFVEVFVIASDNGGLDQPRGLTFKPDGNLLVAGFGSNTTIEYDGQTGASLGKWAQAGTATRLNQVSPWGIRIGPNGNVFIVRTGDDFGSGDGGGGLDHHHEGAGGGDLHLTDALTYEYNARSGWFMRSHIGGNDHGMEFPTGFAFAPDRGTDCNANQLPDNCDIASGQSEDVDENGVPDECEIDCNDNGTFDQFDIIPLGASRDCNANRVPDECDLASGESEDLNDNGTPDECDPDCNYNRVPDDLDIERGESDDCNEDGVPDECQILGNDCDDNGVLDDCDPDCDDDGVPDACDPDVLFGDDFEEDLGWTAINLGATSGDWERGVPVNDPEWAYDPPSDSDGSGQCFVTDNGPGNTDVDDGAVRLVSPRLDMAFGDVLIRYDYYLRMTEPGPDRMLVEINSDDGNGDWIEIALHDTNGGLFWRPHEITQAQLEGLGVVMTDRMRVRFTVNDADPQSIVESGLDAFQVASLGRDCNENGVPDGCDIDNGTSDDENGNRIPDECELGACCDEKNLCENTMRDECLGGGACVRDPAWVCDGDVDGDGQVNPVDSGLVQAAFGMQNEQDLCNYDMDCDGQINPVDSGIVQSLFGTCDTPRSSCPNPPRWFVGEDCESFECP